MRAPYQRTRERVMWRVFGRGQAEFYGERFFSPHLSHTGCNKLRVYLSEFLKSLIQIYGHNFKSDHHDDDNFYRYFSPHIASSRVCPL